MVSSAGLARFLVRSQNISFDEEVNKIFSSSLFLVFCRLGFGVDMGGFCRSTCFWTYFTGVCRSVRLASGSVYFSGVVVSNLGDDFLSEFYLAVNLTWFIRSMIGLVVYTIGWGVIQITYLFKLRRRRVWVTSTNCLFWVACGTRAVNLELNISDACRWKILSRFLKWEEALWFPQLLRIFHKLLLLIQRE